MSRLLRTAPQAAPLSTTANDSSPTTPPPCGPLKNACPAPAETKTYTLPYLRPIDCSAANIGCQQAGGPLKPSFGLSGAVRAGQSFLGRPFSFSRGTRAPVRHRDTAMEESARARGIVSVARART